MDRPTQIMTLGFIRIGDKILLGEKKYDLGKGKLNGYGGKVGNIIKNETIDEALVREFKEESTVDILKYEKRGELIFNYIDRRCIVYVYEITEYTGEPKETQEIATPAWFDIDNLPFNRMWSSDTAWYPYFLQRKNFKGEGTFDDKYNLLSFEVKVV